MKRYVWIFIITFICSYLFCIEVRTGQIIRYEVPIFKPETDMLRFEGIIFSGSTWEIDFSRTSAGIVSHPSYSLFGKPQKFILEIWTSSSGCELEFLFGSHFQYFKRTEKISGYGAQTIEVDAPPVGWGYFGGENDGKVRVPLRFLRLTIKRGTSPSNILQVRILKFICETELNSSQECILLSKIERVDKNKVSYKCEIKNLLPKDVSGSLRLVVRDWEGSILLQKMYSPLSLSGGGEDAYTISVPGDFPEEKNFIEAEWVFERNDMQIFRSYSTICREPDSKVDPITNGQSPWGMGMYLYRYGNNQEAREKAGEMGRKAGVKWTREDFSWARIEPTPGQFVFDYYDNIVETGLRYGISTYALLCYWAPWTVPYSEKGLEDFVNYTKITVEHFKDRIKYWEVYNEPNIFFWQGPKELYPELVKRCYSAIKSIDPDAKVTCYFYLRNRFRLYKEMLRCGNTF